MTFSDINFVDNNTNMPFVNSFNIDALLADSSIGVVICCGAGGVGKTTTAAAIALRAAEQGRRVVVITIDPARRLAQALGLDGELNADPRRVQIPSTSAGGELYAMMLDPKQTFDGLVRSHATPQLAEEIFANRFYQKMSGSFAGTQEYMAMERLGQLQSANEWDLIVVDTPPSRSALDFLDAPERIARFLDGRLARLLLTPVGRGGRGLMRIVGASMSVVHQVLAKVVGVQTLKDVSTFLASLEAIFGNFRGHAEKTYALLSTARTAFLIVTTPRPEALRETASFVTRFRADNLPLRGIVVNQVTTLQAVGLSAKRARQAAEQLTNSTSFTEIVVVLRAHAALEDRIEAERHALAGLVSAHPQVPVSAVPRQINDVYDMVTLRKMGSFLAVGPGSL